MQYIMSEEDRKIDMSKPHLFMKITADRLESLGFEYIDYGNDPPYKSWKHPLSKIEVWNYNDDYWVIDILDQAGLNKKYYTLGDLNTFFKAVEMPLDIE